MNENTREVRSREGILYSIQGVSVGFRGQSIFSKYVEQTQFDIMKGICMENVYHRAEL
jgi:hypothetical protein